MASVIQDKKPKESDTKASKSVAPMFEEDTEDIIPTPISQASFWYSLRQLLSSRNFTVIVTTGWIMNAFSYMPSYFNLYLRSIGWDFISMGILLSAVSVVQSISRLLGGYLGDITQRKNLAVIAVLMYATYYFILGIFVDPIMIVGGCMVLALFNLAKSGSSAFVMESIPKEHGGFGIALFNAGRIVGLSTLIIFGLMVPTIGFPEAFRSIFIVAGISLFLCALVRQAYLNPTENNGRNKNVHLLKDFLSENKRAFFTLLAVAPGLLTVAILDSFSDALFKFAALIYTNEVLNIDISGINIILIITLLISAPLMLKLGRIADRTGIKRVALLVYSVMPISALLLIVSDSVFLWTPESWYFNINAILPSLGVICTLPFIAIVMKYVNDTLWWMVVLTLIRRGLPEQDTSKILSIFWIVVYIASSIGPVIAGFIYEILAPTMLFVLVIGVNVAILGAIGLRNFGEQKIETNKELN